MSRKIVLSLLLVCVGALAAAAQDEAEREFLTPTLHPQHKDKPKVAGWAQQRVEEKLNRGIIAQPNKEGKVYLSWRLLRNDPQGTAFNVYRSVAGGSAVKLNKEPVVVTTDFIDEQPALGSECAYWVRPVVAGKELDPSEKALLKADAGKDKPYYTSIKLQGDYIPQRVALADLNGDGTYDFVIKQPSQGIDPAGGPGPTDLTYKLEAYLSDGTFLWRKDLGPALEPGIWYTPFVVYDFNGDGKAEVAVKTGPDTPRVDGRVTEGPEWVSILDGMTGKELAKADWPPRDPRLGNYNRINRNQMGVAYLDGKTPCVLVARGTYKMMIVDAYQFHDNELKRVWHWDGEEETPVIRSQGAHGMHSIDLDGDGRDEIVLGSVCLDDNGTALWSVGLGHPDKCYVSDIDPTRPGLEVFYGIEPWHDDGKGVCLVEAKTGKMIWSIGTNTYHVGDAMVADIDPSIPGLECFASEDGKGGRNGSSTDKYLFTAAGKRLGANEDVPGCRNWIWWDGDLVRETFGGGFGGGGFPPRGAGRGPRGPGEPGQAGPGQTGSVQVVSVQTNADGAVSSGRRGRGSGRGGFGGGPRSQSIVKYKGETLTTGIEGSIVMMADVLGDWREELITSLPGELRMYSTTIPAKDRRPSLMQDPGYRLEVAHRSMGYEQSPVPSFYLGVPPEDAAKYESTIAKKAAVASSYEAPQN